MSGLIERLFERVYHVEPLVTDGADVVLRLAFQVYRGPDFTLADGTNVRHGDRVVELHMSNERLAEIHREHDDPRRVGLAYMDLVTHSLRVLARAWVGEPRFEGVVAAYGVNLHPTQASRGGFEFREVRPAWRRKFLSWWIRRIVAQAHPQGRSRVLTKDGRPREVSELWLSRASCLAMWGSASRPRKHVGESQGGEA